MMNKLLHYENRLALLLERPKDNSKIIAKLKRQIRNLTNAEA